MTRPDFMDLVNEAATALVEAGHNSDTAKDDRQRILVVLEALTWMGTPHRHQGRVKGAGVDCGMLLAETYEAAGVLPHVDPADYPHDWHLHRSEERFRELVEQHARPVADPLPGDLVLYRFGRTASHGAIVVAWPRILHSYMKAGGVVLDDATANMDLAPRYVGAWSPWGGDR